MKNSDLAAKVKTSSGEYPIWVSWDSLNTIGDRVNDFVGTSTAYIIADQNVQKYVRKRSGRRKKKFKMQDQNLKKEMYRWEKEFL